MTFFHLYLKSQSNNFILQTFFSSQLSQWRDNHTLLSLQQVRMCVRHVTDINKHCRIHLTKQHRINRHNITQLVLGPDSESHVTGNKPTVMCMIPDISQETTASYIPTKGVNECRKTKQTDSYAQVHNKDKSYKSDDMSVYVSSNSAWRKQVSITNTTIHQFTGDTACCRQSMFTPQIWHVWSPSSSGHERPKWQECRLSL